MKIAIAQTKPIKGDIAANIVSHKKLIDMALSMKTDAIFFPELSLTGYEPELAKDLATNQDDSRFDDFQKLSDENDVTIGLGIPTNSYAGVLISMIVFQKNKPRQTYSKQQMHSDELPYFVNGNGQLILSIKNKKIALAICYESLQINHSEEANALGAEVYIASVAKPQHGFEKARKHFPSIAKKYAMPVFMSNCVGYCDNFESVGKSSIWNKKGDQIGQLDNTNEGILIFDTKIEKVIIKN
ncbi:carbon-nitrogen hydrolase family protein [Xanthovirga aplysinae]|uniref:carbon-nitrogen hydrolase family protein n=1 Tax=Xanthovirga aplysinae TaxID=2529853 RepID=UPI0012BCE343|nr:carbon-nitrogen hydrolase family protein [Xanthovirga aplysinae]MTI31242.1 carbon-nitrogen hydrolase family protein [Xanthovirga aplysinae]